MANPKSLWDILEDTPAFRRRREIFEMNQKRISAKSNGFAAGDGALGIDRPRNLGAKVLAGLFSRLFPS